jgi:hypothetical protein
MNGYAYACGSKVYWFRDYDSCAKARQQDWDLMVSGRRPQTYIKPIHACTAAKAANLASPDTPAGEWHKSLITIHKQPTTYATSSLTTATAIIRILSGGRQLRQYQIAAELGLTEYRNWSTHAALNSMANDGILVVDRFHVTLKDGSLSRKAYRHFGLATHTCSPQPQDKPRRRRRDILKDWALAALGF